LVASAVATGVVVNIDLPARIMVLKDHVGRTGLSQSEAAKLLGVTQPRTSDLMRGKIELFGLDTLVNMIGAAGLHVKMRISDAA
jgi:predicted XRE-type DNA-binding protein